MLEVMATIPAANFIYGPSGLKGLSPFVGVNDIAVSPDIAVAVFAAIFINAIVLAIAACCS